MMAKSRASDTEIIIADENFKNIEKKDKKPLKKVKKLKAVTDSSTDFGNHLTYDGNGDDFKY